MHPAGGGDAIVRGIAGLLVAALVAAGCGDDDGAGDLDPCERTTTWQADMAEATNAFGRAGSDAPDASARRRLYLDAFEELEALTAALADDIGEDDPAIAAAIVIGRELLADGRAAAEALDDDAFAVRSVPGGSLFTASERARATVLSAARPACTPAE